MSAEPAGVGGLGPARELRIQIARELAALAEAAAERTTDSGQRRGLDPAEVLEWAESHRDSALYQDLYLLRGEAELALEARLARVRRYIHLSVRITPHEVDPVTISVDVQPATAELYSVPSLRGQGSYLPRAEAVEHHRDEMVAEGTRLLERFVRTYGDLSEFAVVVRAIRRAGLA